MKTSELSGAALDWAVARAERLDCYADMTGEPRPAWAAFVDFGDETHIRYTPSEHWGFGGPIIEREEIELHKWALDGWEAHATNYSFLNTPNEKPEFAKQHGPTPLIAAMRCYVASVLGDEVEIPATLLETV